MLSEDVKKILIKREIPIRPDMTDREAWNEIYALQKRNAKPRPSVSICFTGFGETRAEEFKGIARDLGFGVNASVVKSTTHLCCGENAGPKKLEKARAQGIKVIDEAQFHHMMETGEIL